MEHAGWLPVLISMCMRPPLLPLQYFMTLNSRVFLRHTMFVALCTGVVELYAESWCLLELRMRRDSGKGCAYL